MRWLLAASLAYFCSISSATQLSFKQTSRSIKLNSTVLDVTESPDGEFSAGAYSWTDGVKVSSPSAADLLSTITASSNLSFTVERVGLDVYRLTHADALPYSSMHFQLNGSWVSCGATPDAGLDALSCGGGGQVNASAITVSSQTAAELTVTTTTSTSALDAPATVFGLSRLQRFGDMSYDTWTIRNHVASRRDSSRVAVSFIWVFVGLIAVELCRATAICLSWLIGKRLPGKGRIHHRNPVRFWWIVLLVLAIVCFAAGGLAAFMFLALLCAVVSLATSIALCCKCCRRAPRPGTKAIEVRPGAADHRRKSESDRFDTPTKSDKQSGRCSAYFLEGVNTSAPVKISRGQKRQCVCNCVSMAFLVVCLTIVYSAWVVDDYLVWDRTEQTTRAEFIPQYIAKGVAAMYVFDGWADMLQMNNVFFDVSTSFCGNKYNTVLGSDDDKRLEIGTNFIDKYQIDMTVFNRQLTTDFVSVNDWFIRKLKTCSAGHVQPCGVRPVCSVEDDSVVASPADSRIMVFDVVPDISIWIKGADFTVNTLVGIEQSGLADTYFDGGSIGIFRLAPQDYHRYHSPVTGTITRRYRIDGGLHSVNADGMTSKNYAIFNQREVVIIDTAEFGDVAFVAIGAACVGSTAYERSVAVCDGLANATSVFADFPAKFMQGCEPVQQLQVGDRVVKGGPLGFFQFGGSTNALVFRKNAVEWDSDLLFHSQRRVESLARVGQCIARKKAS